MVWCGVVWRGVVWCNMGPWDSLTLTNPTLGREKLSIKSSTDNGVTWDSATDGKDSVLVWDGPTAYSQVRPGRGLWGFMWH